MSNKKNACVVQLCKTLKQKLESFGMSHEELLTSCFNEIPRQENFSSKKLDDYIARNKLSKLENQKDPDKISLFLNYFNNKYLERTDYASSEDKDAFYEYYSELSSRITTIAINDNLGCDKTALASVYSLFSTQRELCRTYKRNGIKFKTESDQFLNSVVRPFTSKWHLPIESDQYDKSEFRSDLKDLQVASIEYSEKFFNISTGNYSLV